MAQDLESIVANAFSDANEGVVDDTPVDDTPVGEETPIEGEETPIVEGVTEPIEKEGVEKPIVEEKPVVDQLTKDLEELGLKAPKEGERENRLPHSRVRKIAENYGKKVSAKFETTIKEKDTQITQANDRLKNFDNADRLIASDPDRYISMLAAIHPEYKKFIAGGMVKETPKVDTTPAAADAATTAAITALGPRPAHDAKYEDGSLGYSLEQHDKLLDWIEKKAKIESVAEARTEARAEMDRRFGPIEKERAAQAEREQTVPIVKAQVQAVKDTWGADLVKKHEPAIVKAMKDNPLWTPAEAAAFVLVPLTKADRNTMRTELLVEMEGRKKAAAPAAKSAITAGKEGTNDEPRSLEDVVREAVRTLR